MIKQLDVYKKLFRSKDMRWLWGAESISVIGDAFFTMAVMWIVYAESGSMFQSSLVIVVMHVTNVILSPIAGVYADARDRKKIMILTYLASGIITLGVAIFIFFNGEITLIVALLSVILLNVSSTFYAPAKSSVLPDIIGKELLSSAFGLFGTVNQSAALIGKALAGFVIAAIGAAWSVMIDSFALFIGSLFVLMIQIPRRKELDIDREETKIHFIKNIVAGWKVIRHDPVLFSIVYITVLVNMSSFFLPQYPALVSDKLQAGPEVFGFIQATGGAAAIIGALCAGPLEQTFRAGRVTIVAWFIAGLGVIGIGLSPFIWLTILLEFIMVFCLTLSAVVMNTLQISIVPQEYRGRVMSIIGSLAMISVPIMNLLGGFIGDYVGVATIFVAAGNIILIVVPLAALNKSLRQVVIKKEAS
ncbi:MAG TPA: MFS transporter [Bacillota bacterium]|nr:MFS transporter [Bacillota bacterium]